MKQATFDDFVHTLADCTTLAEVSEAFRRAVAAHGYTSSAGRAFMPSAGGNSEILFRNWPRDWASLSDKEDFGSRSFVISEARKRMKPFTWREIMTARPLSAAERKVWDSAQAFGWHNGFVLPVHGPGGYFGIVSMASPERDLDLTPETLMQLQMIAMMTHERCRALGNTANSSGPKKPLTPRELECMRWVADGKTDTQIAHALAISEVTVRFHVDRARKKLGARNRAQGTARLVLYGLY